MTEETRPWPGTTLGDAGPFSANDWYDAWGGIAQASVANGDSRNYNLGVLYGVANELSPSESGTDILVGTGASLIDGLYHENDATVTVPIPAASANPRIDYIVVRKNYQQAITYTPGGGAPTVPFRTARITVIRGAEAASPSVPTLTQDTTRNTYWDIPIATVQVSVGGALSNFTDRREFVDTTIGTDVVVGDNTEFATALELVASVSGGNGANEFGTAIEFIAENDSGNFPTIGKFGARYVSATDGAEQSRIEIRAQATDGENLSGVIVSTATQNADGNARGGGAVDFQGQRSAVDKVASGGFSVVSGGQSNVASGLSSTVSGGGSNTSSNTGSAVGGGNSNTASGQQSTVGGGSSNTASGEQSTVAGGASCVASGDESFVGGGNTNVASNDNAVCSGGLNNTASGTYSAIGGGNAHTASGNASTVAGGNTNDASGNTTSIGGGNSNVASGDFSTISGGFDNEATKDYSAIPGGIDSVTDKYSQVASSSGAFATNGDAQGTIQMVSRASVAHADASWHTLYLDGAGASEQMTIAADTAWTFHILLVGITQNTAQQFSYEINGLIERDNANNTTLAASNVTAIFESDANYEAQVVADDTNEALDIQVRNNGGVNYTIRWVATIRTCEVTYP